MAPEHDEPFFIPSTPPLCPQLDIPLVTPESVERLEPPVPRPRPQPRPKPEVLIADLRRAASQSFQSHIAPTPSPLIPRHRDLSHPQTPFSIPRPYPQIPPSHIQRAAPYPDSYGSTYHLDALSSTSSLHTPLSLSRSSTRSIEDRGGVLPGAFLPQTPQFPTSELADPSYYLPPTPQSLPHPFQTYNHPNSFIHYPSPTSHSPSANGDVFGWPGPSFNGRQQ